MTLDDRVAIVTGGAQGIGGATARRLAEDGVRVLIADIDIETGQANVAAIRESGGTAEALRVDVSKAQDLEAMVRKAVSLWGRVDILVSNAFDAGAAGSGGAVDVTEEAWDHDMAILVKSLFLGAKHAIPEMRKVGGGSIVNVASVHGLLTAPRFLTYETGKSAVIGMTRQMATEFGPMGIRVNSICPGHIVTERLQAGWDGNPSGQRFFEDQYPLRKVGRPVDIANAIAFLCSDQADFITGHALVVDGGLSIQLQENFGVRQGHYLEDHPDTELPY
jgi:NAD(P)-dependent dehydrogenase (short-subunit alcohol dehydrogenase family)